MTVSEQRGDYFTDRVRDFERAAPEKEARTDVWTSLPRAGEDTDPVTGEAKGFARTTRTSRLADERKVCLTCFARVSRFTARCNVR